MWRKNQNYFRLPNRPPGSWGKFAHSLPDAERPPQVVLEDRAFCRLFQAPDGGIPATTDSIAGPVGSAMCFVAMLEQGVFGSTITVTDKEFEVFNFTKVAVCATGERFGTADRDGFGKWWVNAADCSDTG